MISVLFFFAVSQLRRFDGSWRGTELLSVGKEVVVREGLGWLRSEPLLRCSVNQYLGNSDLNKYHSVNT